MKIKFDNNNKKEFPKTMFYSEAGTSFPPFWPFSFPKIIMLIINIKNVSIFWNLFPVKRSKFLALRIRHALQFGKLL